jgi:hypothetical protein
LLSVFVLTLNAFSDGSVHSHTIMDGGVGLDRAPAGFAATIPFSTWAQSWSTPAVVLLLSNCET